MPNATNMSVSSEENTDAENTTKVEYPTLDQVLDWTPKGQPYSKARIKYQEDGIETCREFIVGPDNRYHLTERQGNISSYQELDQSIDHDGYRYKSYKDDNGNYQIRCYEINEQGNIIKTTTEKGTERAFPKGWILIPKDGIDKIVGMLNEIGG